MSTCCWCTPGGSDTVEFLRSYASRSLSPEDLAAANEDLRCCMDCVDEYHKARAELPSLQEALWELETTRLISHLEKDDDLYIVEDDVEMPWNYYTGPDFEKHLKVPLLEILKYPYLLLHKHLSELYVETLCKMEQIKNPCQVGGKYPGIYLLMVHPNEMIRRWAILTARSLSKVDRDDYYDIQEVLICLFNVIELGLLEDPEMYCSSVTQQGKLDLLPPHLYDTKNRKNYWLGICMLLTVLEEQAMESLLLGPDKQNDFLQALLNTMDKETDDDSNNAFWPALQCFMVILDRLGSKVWGQRIDPIQAFQTITCNASYNNEIERIRQSCKRTKSEPLTTSYGDDIISCSQIVYDFHAEKPPKDAGWKAAICPDYCPNLYEEMQTLAKVLQLDVGQDLRLHNNTFLWYIPFVQSLMDLRCLGVAYISVVIYHLCSEIRKVFSEAVQYCDKVSAFFILILVSVVELHHNKKCLDLLCVSSTEWMALVVRCAKLPRSAFMSRPSRNCQGSLVAMPSHGSNSVQHTCMLLIRSLLKEGCQIGLQNRCKPFRDKLNLVLRTDVSEGWQLTPQETTELEECLKRVLRSIEYKTVSSPNEHPVATTALPTLLRKQEKDDGHSGNMHVEHNVCPPSSLLLKKDEACHKIPSSVRGQGLGEEQREISCKDRNLNGSSECLLFNVKQELEDSSDYWASANKHNHVHENGSYQQVLEEQSKRDFSHKTCGGQVSQNLNSNRKLERPKTFKCQTSLDEIHNDEGRGSCSAIKMGSANLENMKIKLEKPEWTLKLKELVKKHKRGNAMQDQGPEGQQSHHRQLNTLLCKPEISSEDTFQVKPLLAKGDCTDRLAEFKNALNVENNSEDSSSCEDGDDIPLEIIRQKMTKRKCSATTVSSLTNSQIDKDLSRLSLAPSSKGIDCPIVSSDEITRRDTKRKVAETVKSWSDVRSREPLSDVDETSNQVIVISDSDEDNKKEYALKERKGAKSVLHIEKQSSGEFVSTPKEDRLTISCSPLPYEECESQCFEFETEDNIYSVWQDSEIDEMANSSSEGQQPVTKPSNCLASSLQKTVQSISDQDYDTDYLGEDVTEKAAEALEQQLKKKDSKIEMKLRLSSSEEPMSGGSASVHSKCFTELPNDAEHSRHKTPVLPTTSSGFPKAIYHLKQDVLVPDKCLAKSQQVRTLNRTSERKHLKRNVHVSKPLQVKPSRSAPAVVPPKKVHHRPPPVSTVEKLGLKKAPRKALDLSQRSLDSLADLRSYGKAAGNVQLPSKRKSKLIPPQKLVDKNRKMLACQDRQFFRQSRSKLRETGQLNHQLSSESCAPKIAEIEDSKQLIQQHGSTVADEKDEHSSNSFSSERKQLRQNSSEKEEVQPTFVSSVSKELLTSSSTSGQESPTALSPPSSNLSSSVTGGSVAASRTLPVSCSSLCDNAVVSKESEPKVSENFEEADDLFLTQMDPVDMEMCSQVENIAMEINMPTGSLQGPSSCIEICKRLGCIEKVSKAGAVCGKCSDRDPSDHLFAKPLAPAKPSTTKIFSSSSSSRNANLTKDLENVPKPSLANKNKSIPSKAPASKVDGFQLKTPTLSSILRPQNSNSMLRSQNMQSVPSSSRIPEVPLSYVVRSGHNVRAPLPQANSNSSQPRDIRMFNVEVLKWTYDMLANSSQLGPPRCLFNSIVDRVPDRFQSYDDYFNTFFPLMMLNAFEMVAQEWQETRKRKEQNAFHLLLLNFSNQNSDVNRADCTVFIPESILNSQQYPKEDELVFLVVPKKQIGHPEENAMVESRPLYLVGLVTRFSHPLARDGKKEQKDPQLVCHLSVQTRGNLATFIDQHIKCFMVSSLVTTQRRFKALLYLQHSPLAKPICCLNNTNFLLSCRRNADSENTPAFMKEFNEDQKRAIDTTHSMVIQQPLHPRICLIHGPPGTGKSKTINGLLYRILLEKSAENPVQSLNAKIKRNRVLVCAPSNAAVDDLMKKIIILFKSCQTSKSALGNCGDINLVRLGQEKSISKDVRRFSLDYQVNHQMQRASLELQELQKRKDSLDQLWDTLSRQRAMDQCKKRETRQQLDEKVTHLSEERRQLAFQLKEVREMKAKIIQAAHIICCTLSTSGGGLLESAFRRHTDPFCCVIVDEAGQACELETLIPLMHHCKKLVLVGDPKQLPPMVRSLKAQDCGYDQSLMGRLCRQLEEQVQANAVEQLPILQLTVQYRMHPDICLFPSNYIYGRSLTTDRRTEESRCSSEWPFQPYLLFDVRDGQEERDNDSFANIKEVKMVVELMKVIRQKRKDIGIITPYSAQKRRLMKSLDKELEDNRCWDVDTVDGFQGREKDCIIVTCVRANSTQGSIGFLKSLPRLNVTITRARYSLFILGHLETLRDNEDWNELIQDAQRRGAIIKTANDRYKKDAGKILKPMLLQQRSLSLPGLGIPDKKLQGQRGSISNERNEIPSRKDSHFQKTSASAGTPTQGFSTGGRLLNVSQDSVTRKSSLPTQGQSVCDSSRDPRLARRVQEKTAEPASKGGSPSASGGLGIAVPLRPDAPSEQRNWINSIQTPSSETEAFNKPIPHLRPQGLPLPARLPSAHSHNWRVPIGNKEVKTLYRRDRQYQAEYSKDEDYSSNEDYRSGCRRTSGEALESRDPIDAKRRKTTY